MYKKIVFLIAILSSVSLSFAQSTFYMWRQRLSLSCSSLVDGKPSDMCFDLSSSKIYICRPTDGVTCKTPSEWHASISSGSAIESATLPLNFSLGVLSINDATTSSVGVVQVSNTYSDTSTATVPTSKALSDGLSTKEDSFTNGTLSVSLPILVSGTPTGALVGPGVSLSMRDASTTDSGVTTLSNSYNGTSESHATTEKALSDGLATKASLSGASFTGDVSTSTNLSATGTVSASNFSGSSSGTNTGDQDLSGYVPNTRKINGYDLEADRTLYPSDIGLSNVDNTSDLDKPISTATQSALDGKVSTTTTVNGHALSSNVTVTATDLSLGNVDNTSDLNKPISTATQSALDLKEGSISIGTTGQYWRGDKTFQNLNSTVVGLNNVTNDAQVKRSEMGISSGVATLDAGGKVPTSQLPTTTITSTYVVASQVEMLALSAAVGDVAVRTDTSKTYVLQNTPASVLGNWVELLFSSPVISVNSKTGSVNLTTDDVSEGTSNQYSTTVRIRAALSGTSPVTYNSGSGAIGIQTANGSQAGALSSTDWNTFNNKVSSQWSTAGSSIYYNLGNVGIGTSVPSNALDVVGGLGIIGAGNFGVGTNDPNAKLSIKGVGTGTAKTLSIKSSNETENITVYDNGNVGIGSTSPTQVFNLKGGDASFGSAATTYASSNEDVFVKGNLSVDGKLYGDGSGLTGLSVISGLNSGYLSKAATSTSINDSIIYQSGSNIGISSTNPGYKLDVGGIVNSTGLYVNGSPYIGSQWTTAGSSIYYNTGNVGIGSSTPSQALDVAGVTQTQSIVTTGTNRRISGGSGYLQFDDDESKIYLGGTGSSSFTLDFTSANPALYPAVGTYLNLNDTLYSYNGYIGIGTYVPTSKLSIAKTDTASLLKVSSSSVGNGDYLILTSNGNVGINTLYPSSKLQIGSGTPVFMSVTDKDAYIGGNLEVGGQIYGPGSVNNLVTNYFTYAHNAHELSSADMYYDSGSTNIGIGTSTMTAKLQVNGTVKANAFIGDGSAITGIPGSISGLTTGYLPKASSSSTINDSVIYQSGSNIGIGTTVPNNALDVVGGLGIIGAGNFGIGTSDPNAKLSIKGVGTGIAKTLSVKSSSETENLTILDNGNIGINSTIPTTYLDIASSGAHTAISVGELDYYSIGTTSGTLNIQYPAYTAASTNIGRNSLFVQGNNGNVGINSTNPSSKLDVVGTIKATQFSGDGAYITNVPMVLANPTGTVGLTAVNGTSASALRSDGAPALSQAITPTWTGTHTFNNPTYSALFTGGNVGIGSSTPTGKLDFGNSTGDNVVLYSTPSGKIALNIDPASASLNFTNTNTSGNYNFYNADGSNIMYINTTTRNVAIGSTLYTNASLQVKSTTASNIPFQVTSYSGSTGGDYVLVNSAGNVGIGSTTPSYKLEVNGTSKIKGGFYNVVNVGASTTYNVTVNDDMIFCTGSGITLNLPQVSTVVGKAYKIIFIPTTSVIIDPYSTELINGTTTSTVSTGASYIIFDLVNNGTAWYLGY